MALRMGFTLFVWSILCVPMFLYFMTAAVAGFFSARLQACVVALAGLAVTWMCAEFGRGGGFAPFVALPTLVLYAIATGAAIIASHGMESAYIAEVSASSGVDGDSQA